MPILAQHLAQAFVPVAMVACARTFPFVIYSWNATHTTRAFATALTCAYVAFVALATVIGQTPPLLSIAAAFSYYALIACITHGFAYGMRAGHLSRLVVGTALVILCLFLPARVWPVSAPLVFLVIGWDVGVSAYSYCVDTLACEEMPPLTDCIFFLLVDPNFVFAERAYPATTPPSKGNLSRIALGLIVLFAANAVLRPVSHWISAHEASLASNQPVAIVSSGVVTFLLFYALHSGLASLQIGLLRQSGLTIRERYRLPWLALTPIDFWRRWNLYMASWIRRYLYTPLMFQLLRKYPERRRAIAQLVTTLSFTMVGIMHDIYIFAQSGTSTFRCSRWFFAMGILCVVWTGITGRPEKNAARKTRVLHGHRAPFTQFIRHAAFCSCCAVAAAYWVA